MNKPNISDIHNCYGCGVCTKACPVHIIVLHLNKEGFYEPFIAEEDKCIHCGLCRDVCAYIKDEPAQNSAPVVSGLSISSQVPWKNWYRRQGASTSRAILLMVGRP